MLKATMIYLMTFGYWILPDTGSGMLGQAQKAFALSFLHFFLNCDYIARNHEIFSNTQSSKQQVSEEFVTEIAFGHNYKGLGCSIYSVMPQISRIQSFNSTKLNL
jgi:hypothetical protein